MKVYVAIYDCSDGSTVIGDVFNREKDARDSAQDFFQENKDWLDEYDIVESDFHKSPVFKKMCPQCGSIYWMREVRSQGTIFCSKRCAKNSTQKTYRDRKKEQV